MELPLLQANGDYSGAVKVDDAVFATPFKEPLIHQVVTAYLAGRRAGTSSQKNRSQVRGGGRKPHRQKGTGRARAGTIRSPLWRGGGVIFANTTRSYAQKVNRKAYRVALRSILSELIRQDRLRLCDAIEVEEPRTRGLLQLLKQLNISGESRVLLITEEHHANLTLACRNVIGINSSEASRVDPVSLVDHGTVIFTTAALKKMESSLQ